MKAVVKKLCGYESDDIFRVCKPVWFQAWKYAEEDAILAALLEEIFKTMEADGLIGRIKSEIEKLATGLQGQKIVGKLSQLLTAGTVDVTEFFAEPEYKEKLGFVSEFQEFFDRLVAAYVSKSEHTGVIDHRAVDDTEGVLVVFVDDLDRCPKPRVLKVLETIKLFMDKTGCVFVIGAAQEVIESAIRETYQGRGEAEKFMDKIVQVTFVPPKIPEPEIGTFIAKVVQDQYKNKDCWSENGWKWKETERVNEPASWNAPEGNQPDHPVVGVSLYEAEAYAKWAGKRLPTEQEWERAARGTDGRVYPWGDEFDKEKCNSWEADIGRTTPVTKYVNGLSPDGCYDMAGNVWEWTASREEDFFVIRGGSWYDATQLVRSAFRSMGMLTFRYDNVGFRCAKTP